MRFTPNVVPVESGDYKSRNSVVYYISTRAQETDMVSKETLKDLAIEAGFDLVGFTTPPTREETVEYSLEIDERKSRGFKPRESYPWMESWRIPDETRSIVVLGFNYYQELPEEPLLDSELLIARYLTGSCPALISRLKKFHRSLEVLGIKVLSHIGPSELPLKWLAKRAGLGWIGKNSLLLTEEYGSWVIWDAVPLMEEFPPDEPKEFAGCGDCDECVRACPTSAIYEPYKLDPLRCFTYFSETLASMDGAWPIRQAREAFGRRILGCDICQDVCPHNRHVNKSCTSDVARLPLHIDASTLINLDEDTFENLYRLMLWGIPKRRVQEMLDLMHRRP